MPCGAFKQSPCAQRRECAALAGKRTGGLCPQTTLSSRTIQLEWRWVQGTRCRAGFGGRGEGAFAGGGWQRTLKRVPPWCFSRFLRVSVSVLLWHFLESVIQSCSRAWAAVSRFSASVVSSLLIRSLALQAGHTSPRPCDPACTGPRIAAGHPEAAISLAEVRRGGAGVPAHQVASLGMPHTAKGTGWPESACGCMAVRPQTSRPKQPMLGAVRSCARVAGQG